MFMIWLHFRDMRVPRPPYTPKNIIPFDSVFIHTYYVVQVSNQ